MKVSTISAAAVTAAFLAGCNAGGISQVPSTSQVNLNSVGKLQIAVGTVNIGTDGNKTGLNVVATFRQSNGLSAVLLDTPTLTGPAGFTNTASSTNPYDANNRPDCNADIATAGADAGTNHISGDPQNPSVSFVPSHTFGEAALVGAYGIQPFNSTNNSAAYYPGSINGVDCNPGDSGATYQAYPQPFYLSQAALSAITGLGLHAAPTYIAGPPAYPFFGDGSAYNGFAGFVQGFTAFDLAPVAGQYTLSLNIPASNAAGATVTAQATLSNPAPLGNMGAPTYTSDGTGGGSGTVTVPSGVTETMVYVRDESAGANFAVGPLKGTGTLNYTLPDNLGQCVPVGCQKTSPAASIASGHKVFVYAAGFDYPMFEASPPGSTQQTPAIAGSNGQADITLSPVTAATE
ncbi:MAG: hypothetical protein ACXWNJ_15345 [Vulcanimicrobiaceae bacterium]